MKQALEQLWQQHGEEHFIEVLSEFLANRQNITAENTSCWTLLRVPIDFDPDLLVEAAYSCRKPNDLLRTLLQLTTSLNAQLIAGYLNSIYHEDVILNLNPISLNEIPQSVTLPNNFANSTPPAQFSYGNKVSWIPISGDTDWGIILGRFYAYARHREQWGWKYIVLLDQNSPSSRWTTADTAWEEDLKPLTLEVVP